MEKGFKHVLHYIHKQPGKGSTSRVTKFAEDTALLRTTKAEANCEEQLKDVTTKVKLSGGEWQLTHVG